MSTLEDAADPAAAARAEPDSPARRRIFLITGMSGAGRSTALKALEPRREGWIGLDEVPHLRVAPGAHPQFRYIMRIAQEADVEDQIRVARQPVAIGE